MPNSAALQNQFAIVTLAYDPDGEKVHVESATEIDLSRKFGSAHFANVDSAIEQITIGTPKTHLRFRLPERARN